MSSEKESLSKRQSEILRYVWDYVQEAGRPPTIREIGAAANISSTSVVNYNLTKLMEKGYLNRDAEVSRGLRLTEKARALYGAIAESIKGLVRVPLVGDIVAAQPVEVGHDTFPLYDHDDCVELGPNLLPDKTDDLFALRVRGDSMIDAMVNDGDIVIMRQQETFRNGDMLAVWLTPSDTTTLKYVFNEGDRVRLQPANPTMEPIFVAPTDVRVQGKVMMVVRQVG
jgi:repressor LexA